MGARVIIERMEAYGVPVERVINCGGISVKNPLAMQIYADVMGKPMEVSRSEQTCALGSAMAGAVVAGETAGGHAGFAGAAAAMTAVRDTKYVPEPASRAVYERLYANYKMLHDAFGARDYAESLYNVMKDLLAIRDRARA